MGKDLEGEDRAAFYNSIPSLGKGVWGIIFAIIMSKMNRKYLLYALNYNLTLKNTNPNTNPLDLLEY